MSKTPVETSVDVKVRVASHLSKVPLTATDAFTANLTELSSVVILKVGACARLNDGNTADARRQRTANRMVLGVSFSDTKFLLWVAKRQPSESQIMLGYHASVVLGHRPPLGNWQNR